MLTQRQNKLLKVIIQQYVKTAQPVGSEWLAEKFNFEISPATIRNEMADLIELGFLLQPHTSAGRVPAEKAYHYFVENFLEERGTEQKIKQGFKDIRSKKLTEALVREIGKKMAELSGELAILAMGQDEFYYTGLSYLFIQPEFVQTEIVYDISKIVDQLDRIMIGLFDDVTDETRILLGRENPFGNYCGAILTSFRLPWQRQRSIFGLLGPMRMNYSRNLSIVNYVKELISDEL